MVRSVDFEVLGAVLGGRLNLLVDELLMLARLMSSSMLPLAWLPFSPSLASST